MITVHSIVRDEEQFVWYSLMSVAPFVEQTIVFLDMNSTDKTHEILWRVRKQIPSVEIHTRTPEKDYKNFGLLRDEQIRMTKTPFFLVVDGDEVYTRAGIEGLINWARNFPPHKNILNTRIYWFASDRFHIYYSNFTLFSYTGRLMRTKGAVCEGGHPGEMLYYKHEPRLEFIDPAIVTYHYAYAHDEKHFAKAKHATGVLEELNSAEIVEFGDVHPEVFDDNFSLCSQK